MAQAKQQQKIDLSKLTEEEKIIYQKYGKLPTKKDMINHKLKERKYFDSGDYALYKAGKSGPSGVGSVHASPEMIPHSNPASNNHQPSHPHQIASISPETGTATENENLEKS